MGYRNEKKTRLAGTLVILAFFAASVILGSIGWRDYLAGTATLSVTDIAYLLLMTFTVNASFELPNVPAFLDIARFLAPATLAGTVIFVMLDFFGERVRSIAVATLYRNHTVFVGRDARALIVAADIARDEKVVFALIEPDEEIEGGIAEIDALSIRCPLGAREAFAKTALARARRLFVMDGNDAGNLSLSNAAETFLSRSRARVKPSIFTGYSDFFSLRVARETDEARAVNGERQGNAPSRRSFNLELLVARDLVDRRVIEAAKEARSGRRFQAAVFGFGPLGQAIAFEIAATAHLPDLERPRVVIVDRDVASARKDFIAKAPRFESVVDVEYVELAEWRERLAAKIPEAAFIALDDAALAFDTARSLRQLAILAETPSAGAGRVSVSIIPPIETPESFPPVALARDFLAAHELDFVDPGEALNGRDIVNRAESCDALAKAIHYSWLAPTGAKWNEAAIEREWAGLSDTLRDSNRYSARHLPVKLALIGYELVRDPSPEALAQFNHDTIGPEAFERLGRMEHNRWVAEKSLAGFLPAAAQNHPDYARHKSVHHLHENLVPWESLSRADQLKDMNVLANARQIANAAGFSIQPMA